MVRKLQCKQFRPVQPKTLQKESCNKLWKRMECYMIGKTKMVHGKQVQESYFPYSEKDPSNDNPISRNFTDVLTLLESKTCPPITTEMVVSKLESTFPTHRFKSHYNVIDIPHTFSDHEMNQLEQKIETISASNYALKHNTRLGRYYLSPKKKKDRQKNNTP